MRSRTKKTDVRWYADPLSGELCRVSVCQDGGGARHQHVHAATDRHDPASAEA